MIEAAIGREDGSSFLDGSTASPLAHRVIADGVGAAVRVVSLQSILDVAPGAEPFILKVDIEGGEKGLFQGDPELLGRFPLIMLEPHDFCLPGQDVSAPFLRFHANAGRDFLFANENIFSIDYRKLVDNA